MKLARLGFFSDDVKWKDREELLEWARRQANKAGFTIVTQRSSLINPMLRLVCERSGAHKVPGKKNQSMRQRAQENMGACSWLVDILVGKQRNGDLTFLMEFTTM